MKLTKVDFQGEMVKPAVTWLLWQQQAGAPGFPTLPSVVALPEAFRRRKQENLFPRDERQTTIKPPVEKRLGEKV